MKVRFQMLVVGVLASVFASTAAAGIVSFNAAGPVSYSYSGAGGNALTADANASANVVIDDYQPFGNNSGVTGITTSDTNPGTLLWHFQTGAGLKFSNDVNLNVGSGAVSGGIIVGEYSTNGVTYTPWDTNNNVIDMNFVQASNVAANATDLYVRFTLTGNGTGFGTGNEVLTWGGTPGERSFTLSGTVVPVPEPSSLALLAFGSAFMWFVKRRRK